MGNCSTAWRDGNSPAFDFSKRNGVFTLSSFHRRTNVFLFWHVTCGLMFMARKLNPSKLQRQNNGVTPALPRRSSPPVAALYLMQLREQGIKITPSSRRTRVQVEEDLDIESEQPVKITKVDKNR